MTVEGEGRGGEGIEGGVEVNGCDGSERMSVDEPVSNLALKLLSVCFLLKVPEGNTSVCSSTTVSCPDASSRT